MGSRLSLDKLPSLEGYTSQTNIANSSHQYLNISYYPLFHVTSEHDYQLTEIFFLDKLSS